MSRLAFEVATASWIGMRSRQEDAVLAHVPPGDEPGLVVLSDGMGGHSDGDIASRAIVTEVLADLFLAACRADALRVHGAEILRRAAEAANHRLLDHTRDGAGQEGMGGTLVSGVIQDDGLRWISVGDSPLYLLRDGRLQRLNADHSLAPQIDLMVERGEICAEEALAHPQRSVLTSALTGGPVAQVDCPEAPIALHAGDIVLFASDGVAVLDAGEIADLLHRHRRMLAGAIAQQLIREVELRGEPDQDNVSVAVLTVRAAAQPAAGAGRALGEAVPAWRQRAGQVLQGLRARGLPL